MTVATPKKLENFVQYCQQHIKGDQKSESQTFQVDEPVDSFFDEPVSQLYKLHKKLEQLVMKAYGFKQDDDILEKLLHLNLELAEKEKQGESVIGPWAVDNPPTNN